MMLADEAATLSIGHRIGHVVQVGDVIALSGPLGAGKTALARGLIAALGFEGEVPSPSFALVIPYAPPEISLPVWHVDLYRIEDAAEIDELGLDEARAGGLLIIEWAERMGSRLWADALTLTLAVAGNGRCLTADAPPSWEDRWPLR